MEWPTAVGLGCWWIQSQSKHDCLHRSLSSHPLSRNGALVQFNLIAVRLVPIHLTAGKIGKNWIDQLAPMITGSIPITIERNDTGTKAMEAGNTPPTHWNSITRNVHYRCCDVWLQIRYKIKYSSGTKHSSSSEHKCQRKRMRFPIIYTDSELWGKRPLSPSSAGTVNFQLDSNNSIENIALKEEMRNKKRSRTTTTTS